jgi:hypothetical protein
MFIFIVSIEGKPVLKSDSIYQDKEIRMEGIGQFIAKKVITGVY